MRNHLIPLLAVLVCEGLTATHPFAQTLVDAAAAVADASLTLPEGNSTTVLRPASAGPMITERGQNHRVWEYTTGETDADGNAVQIPHRYVELEDGMHFWQRGQWQETREEFQIVNDHAVAQAGPHHVILAGNLNAGGAVDMMTPDGKRFLSNPMGLSFYDAASGKNVLLAEVKDCVGELQAPNVVIYPDAFTDIKGAIRYTYTKTGLEQDVILYQSPGRPEDYGLNPATTRLEMYTEFHQAPVPTRSRRQLSANLVDESLDFGATQFGVGRAFSVGSQEITAPVGKEWGQLADPNAPGGARTFLTEAVEYPAIEATLAELDAAPQATLTKNDRVFTARADLWLRHPSGQFFGSRAQWPGFGSQLSGFSSQPALLASARRSAPDARPSLVLDYTTVNTSSQANYVFKGDTTYYINGTVTLTGTNSIEGGTVLKYATNASVVCNGALLCLSTA